MEAPTEEDLNNIPLELGLYCSNDNVLQMWKVWHEKRRGNAPADQAGSSVQMEEEHGEGVVADRAISESPPQSPTTSVAKTEEDIQCELQAESKTQ